jgi:hypothetical protein
MGLARSDTEKWESRPHRGPSDYDQDFRSPEARPYPRIDIGLRKDRRVNLPPPWRKLLLTVHVITAVSVLGTDLALLVLGISSVRGADPQTIYPAAHLVATWLLAPLAIVALGTGVLLGLLTQWGLLRYWWVTIKLVLTAILTGVILFVLVPRLGVAADAATALDPRPFTDAERLPLLIAPAAGVTLLMLIVVLAIYKPGWRLRSHPKRRHELG